MLLVVMSINFAARQVPGCTYIATVKFVPGRRRKVSNFFLCVENRLRTDAARGLREPAFLFHFLLFFFVSRWFWVGMRGEVRPTCPWVDDNELGVTEVTPGTHGDGFVSNEVAEETLRALVRRLTAGESLTAVDAHGGATRAHLGSRGATRQKRGIHRKETRVSELVSIVEVVGEVVGEEEDDDEYDDDDDDDEEEEEDRLMHERGRDTVEENGADTSTDDSLLFRERGRVSEAMPNVHEAVGLVALFSEHMPESDAPVALLDAVCAATRQSVEELAGAVLHATLPRLHDVIVAHVEFDQAQVCSVTLESYDGPNAWERCMGCMELTWLVKHVHPDTLGEEGAFMVLLHALALGSKDVSYRVRNQSLECLDALIGVLKRRPRGNSGAYARAVSDIVKESVSANDDRCWSSSHRCMGHLIGLLGEETGFVRTCTEGEGAHRGERDEMIAELFEHGLGAAQRNRHSLVYASVWLDTLGIEMQALGVELMHHRPVLVPMLVDWAKALHAEVRLGAMRCLLVYVQQCWPRNRAIEAMIRSDLQEIRDVGSDDEACVALLDGIDAALGWS